jgi:hypothetical protein
MVKRLSGPCPTSATALAKECGIPQQTLSRWLREASTVPPMSNEPDKPAARPDRTAEEKLRVVLEASRLSEAELGAYLRREGLHSTQLEAWRHAMLESLSDANSPAKRHSAERRRAKKEAERIRALERDLDRKNKALAEVTALLALQKKSRRSGGTGTTARDRRTRPDPRTCRRGHARRRQPGRCGRAARRTATNPSALAQARHRRGPSGRTKGTTRQQAHRG